MDFKTVLNRKGVYLLQMALLLPIIVMFWGWIIGRALRLDYEVSYQIATDMASLSGAAHGRSESLYSNVEDLHTNMGIRSQQILNTFGLSTSAVPTVQKDQTITTVTVIAETQPAVDLLFISNVLISKTSQAQISHKGDIILLP